MRTSTLPHRTTKQRPRSGVQNRRAGIATLELVLCLPVVLVMLVALVWLGFSVIGQAKVAVEARHESWSQRFEPWSQTPLSFSDRQESEADASTNVNVSPLLADFGDPRSNHVVEQGNWDHRSLEFDAAPNWQRYADFGLAAVRENLRSDFQDAREQFTGLSSLSDSFLSDLMTDATTNLLHPGDLLDAGARDGADRVDRDRRDDQRRKQDRIETIERQIDAVQDRIDGLDQSADTQDALWIAESERKRLKIQLQLLEDHE